MHHTHPSTFVSFLHFVNAFLREGVNCHEVVKLFARLAVTLSDHLAKIGLLVGYQLQVLPFPILGLIIDEFLELSYNFNMGVPCVLFAGLGVLAQCYLLINWRFGFFG